MTGRRSRKASARFVVVVIAWVMLATGCANWSMLGAGPARNGHNLLETKLNVGNVAGLLEAWSATLPMGGALPTQPVVGSGFVFVSGASLAAFDAAGTTGCGGEPRTCEPVWTAAAGGGAPPALLGGVVYAVSELGTSATLSAFDARGVTNCSGTPTTCQPLWTASTGPGLGSPAVSGGVVYVGSDRLYAFDASGRTRCGGSPKVCAPLWTSASAAGTTPVVANGVVYVNTDVTLSAFDASGTTGCSGAQPTCTPLWTYTKDPFCSGGCPLSGPPSVAGGRVYLTDEQCCSGGIKASAVLAFDAGGVDGCSGAPKTCAPLAVGSSGSTTSFPKPPVAAAEGRVYANDLSDTVYDADGLTRLWRTTTSISSASIANGVHYALGAEFDSPSSTVRLRPVAYDARGSVNCGGTPKVCSPLWSGPRGPVLPLVATVTADLVGPTVVNGTVYVRTDRLRAYTLP